MAKRQSKLYRTPRKPGYLGGYNWPAVALGCLLLLVVNFIATQYIAVSFQYQPALGAPMLRAKSGGIYQPFSWIVWGWRYCTSQDERIRRPLFKGEMIVFAGSVLCVAVFFVLAGRRGGAKDSHVEHARELLHQLPGPQAVQILQHTVVGQDLHLVVREDDAEE